MVRGVLSVLLVCLHAVALVSYGQYAPPVIPTEPPTPKLPPVSPRDAIQAKDGAVWVIADDGLFRTDGDHWQEVRISKNVGDRALVLGRAPDGGVVTLWEHRESGRYAIVSQAADGGTVKAVLLAKQLRNPQILGTRDGGYIVTEQGPRIFRCAPGEKEEKLIYTIAPDQCVRWGRPAKEFASWNPIYAVEDAKKRIWIYSNVAAGSLDSASLRGVLLIDGGVTRHIPIIPGLADRPLSVLTPMDDQVFWAAVPEDGLYQLYVDEMRADPVPEPAPQVFSGIERIVATRDAWWFVSRPLRAQRYLTNGLVFAIETMGQQTVLWRLPKDSDKITVVLDNVDKDHIGSWAVRRPIVETKDGTLVGSLGYGMWFVPKAGEPFRMDWHAGFPLHNVERLFLLGPSRYLAIDFGHAVHIGVYNPAPQPKPASSIVEHTFRNLIARDSHGHFWALPANKSSVLAEWTGEAWREYPLPKGIVEDVHLRVATDPRRIWLISDAQDSAAAWFDPQREEWTTFPSLRDAYQAVAKEPAPVYFSDTLLFPPAFSKDGRIIYASHWAAVNYFDGQRWREWGGDFLGQDITGDPSLPFFNADGLPCLNRGQKTFAFAEDKGWHEAAYVQRPEFERYPGDKEVAPAPSMGTMNHESIVIDETTGDWWFTARGQLYKANQEMYAPVFAPGDNHPFLDGRGIYSAQTDFLGKGGVFLLTSQEAINTYIQILPPPAPETRVTVATDPEGNYKAQFSAVDDTLVTFQWQIDDFPWSQPTNETEVILPPLKLGTHRLKARAINRFLVTDPTPAEIPIEISPPPLSDGAVLLRQLTSGDPDARERASKALSKLGSAAAVALREARETADNEARWWIDATLQEIERLQRQSEKATKQP